MHDPIDSRKLQIFLCLAQKGSLKAAAPELFLTNSAVSHAISSLEASLGVKLFHRSGKGLVLTEKGDYLYRKAIPVVARMDNIRSELVGAQLEDSFSLNIAAGFNFLSFVLPDVVREFNECFPRGSINVRAAERDASLQLLRDREVDAAIMVQPPDDGDEFTYQKLFVDEPRLLINARSPLSALEIVPLGNLAMKTLIVSRAQSHTVKDIQSQMARKGVRFRDCVEVGSTSAVCEMVKLGQGVGFLPDWVLSNVSNSSLLVTRPVEGLRMERTWAFVRARWTVPGLSMRTFTRLCQQATAGLAGRVETAAAQAGLVAACA